MAETGAEQGLSSSLVEERAALGLQNLPVEPPTRTLGQIIRSNTLTYFNGIFLILAALLFTVRASIFNFSFLVVIVVNAVIGIVQELRSKKALDALTILNSPQAAVVRNGALERINAQELVRDDIVEFRQGDQICADALVLTGECQVNEALVTGEADEIRKGPGDALLSGSFLVAGCVRARLTAVGAESFVNRLTLDAKRQKKIRLRGMMRSLNQLVSIIGILLIPLGAALIFKELEILHRPPVTGVTSAVGALVGMIPEGLFLLTSMALAAGVLRLARRRTMVRDLGCIETLARVDTLCVDKTGTITENKMIVEDIVPLCPDRFIADDIRMVMADYVHAMQGDNDTMAALRRYFTGQAMQTAISALPFSSARKYGGVSFHEDETWLLGAPEVLLGDAIGPYKERIDRYSSLGCRVLLLCLYDGQLSDQTLDAPKMPVALILLANKIRPEAPDTFGYFARQGVTVRVISGDSPLTVAEVARRAGIPGAERCVDARALETEEDIAKAAKECIVFGRVTPEQKRKLVLAMKKQGHTVAMTGDGVNDVLALKEADCSIALASGSEVACQVSQIVLMDSDFSAMPSVVAEGRRVINNIERSASLFLVKNIFSMIVALLSLVFALPYPLTPAQLGLVNGCTIGIPSFVMAMEPNEERIRGHFLRNVLFRALPAALTDAFLVEGTILFYLAARLPDQTLGTICAGIMGVVGLLMVWRTAQPLNTLRKIMLAGVSAGFVISFLWLKPIFGLVHLNFLSALILGVFVLLAIPVFTVMEKLTDRCREALRGALGKLRSLRETGLG
ncbi:MAG: HAD-IC family P-type ATPase [Oscillospiraceae bacterium]|nr:HAD-IC family P-type ATPase [Oscillospiraceae bacterium]